MLKMKADRAAIIMLLVVGMLLGVLSTFGLSIIVPVEEPINVQARAVEQVSIEEEEEMTLIGVYRAGFLNLYKLHDNKDNITCWVYNRGGKGGGGISCIPDHMLTP